MDHHYEHFEIRTKQFIARSWGCGTGWVLFQYFAEKLLWRGATILSMGLSSAFAAEALCVTSVNWAKSGVGNIFAMVQLYEIELWTHKGVIFRKVDAVRMALVTLHIISKWDQTKHLVFSYAIYMYLIKVMSQNNMPHSHFVHLSVLIS